MRLKYHLELETEGVLILESEPQMRNIFVSSQTGNMARIPFPYIQFVVRYIKEDRNLYFPGVWGSGLRVFGKLTPLTSMTDDVFLLPTDALQGGYVCTNHQYDMKKFPSLEIMAKTILSLWWNVRHNIDGSILNKLRELSLNDLDKFDWPKPRYGSRKTRPELWDALKVGYPIWQNQYMHYGVPSFDTNIPIDGIIIDEPWDDKKIEFKLANAPEKKKRGRPKKVKDEVKV